MKFYLTSTLIARASSSNSTMREMYASIDSGQNGKSKRSSKVCGQAFLQLNYGAWDRLPSFLMMARPMRFCVTFLHSLVELRAAREQNHVSRPAVTPRQGYTIG